MTPPELPDPYVHPGKGTQPIDRPVWGYEPPGDGAYRTTNGLATWALIMALLWGFGLLSLIAISWGHKARRQIKARGQDGGEIATLALVLGYLGILPALFVLLVAVT